MDTAIYTPRPCCYPSDLSAANQTGFKSDVNATWKCRGRIQAWSLAASYLPLPHQPRVPFSKPPSSLANTTTSGSGSNHCPMAHPTQVRSQISRVKCYKPHWIPNKVLHRYWRHTTALKHAQTALPRHQHAIYYKARATPCILSPRTKTSVYQRFSGLSPPAEHWHQGLNPGDLQAAVLDLAQLGRSLAPNLHTFLPAGAELRAKGFLSWRSSNWFIALCSCNQPLQEQSGQPNVSFSKMNCPTPDPPRFVLQQEPSSLSTLCYFCIALSSSGGIIWDNLIAFFL